MKKKGMKMVLLMDGRRGKMKGKTGFFSSLSPCKQQIFQVYEGNSSEY